MGSPKPPAPPDPKETSAAQTGTNVGTAIANNSMQMVDQYTPYGNLTYQETGTKTYDDPYTGQTYEIPRYTATTELNPQQQATLEANQRAETGLANTAADQSEFLRDYLGTPADFSTGAIESRLDELGRARLDPRFERESEALESRLANQGLQPGSAAWQAHMDQLGQNKNDAYNQLYLTGRNQAVGEMRAERNQPINEITALLSGSQVSNPNVAPMTPGAMPTTDVAGLINTNYNQRLGNWQIQNQGRQSLMGGLFGLGASAISGGLF